MVYWKIWGVETAILIAFLGKKKLESKEKIRSTFIQEVYYKLDNVIQPFFLPDDYLP